MRAKVFGVLPFVLWTATLNAQDSSGSLRGVVQDSAKARVGAAIIELELSGSAQIRRVASDARGEFRIESLTPGSWHVRVDARSFASASADVSIVVSAVREITVTLQPSTVQQTVGVQAQGSSISTQPVDLSSNVHQSIVTNQDLQQLPLPARSFANI